MASLNAPANEAAENQFLSHIKSTLEDRPARRARYHNSTLELLKITAVGNGAGVAATMAIVSASMAKPPYGVFPFPFWVILVVFLCGLIITVGGYFCEARAAYLAEEIMDKWPLKSTTADNAIETISGQQQRHKFWFGRLKRYADWEAWRLKCMQGAMVLLNVGIVSGVSYLFTLTK